MATGVPAILGDIVGEFARGFRHISAIAASASMSALLGVISELVLQGPAAVIFANLFFGIAAMPLAALVVRQSLHVLWQISDPHEQRSVVGDTRAGGLKPRRSASARKSVADKTSKANEEMGALPSPSEKPFDPQTTAQEDRAVATLSGPAAAG
jgi:predicted lipid-binding transport protein (Tim44 family)